MEINASPSLTASNPADYDLKFALLTDVLNVIDMEGRLVMLAYTINIAQSYTLVDKWFFYKEKYFVKKPVNCSCR